MALGIRENGSVETAGGGGIVRGVGFGIAVSCDSLKHHGSGVGVLVPAGVAGTGGVARGVVGQW